jgi:hypothetical protein
VTDQNNYIPGTGDCWSNINRITKMFAKRSYYEHVATTVWKVSFRSRGNFFAHTHMMTSENERQMQNKMLTMFFRANILFFFMCKHNTYTELARRVFTSIHYANCWRSTKTQQGNRQENSNEKPKHFNDGKMPGSDKSSSKRTFLFMMQADTGGTCSRWGGVHHRWWWPFRSGLVISEQLLEHGMIYKSSFTGKPNGRVDLFPCLYMLAKLCL